MTTVPDPIERYAGTLERTPAPEAIPWSALRKPLRECRYSLVTTGGVHMKDDKPFDTSNDGYDWSYREIPLDAPVERLMVTHNHYDHAHVDRDINAMFPVERFRELQSEHRIGPAGPRGFGLYGFIREPEKLAEETAPRIAAALKEDEVDAVFLTPG